MVLFICYPKCSTCAKAERWLNDHQIEFQKRNISTERPTADELDAWIHESGLPLRKFFNTSGKKYRELNMKDRMKTMSDQEILELLASDGMLVKRPILVSNDTVLAGFKMPEWEKALLK